MEAFKQTHVKAAIDGISNLRMGSWSQQMVPIKEMTDVLRVVKEAAGLKVKQWVRIKRGVFKDDLAQVDYVDVASNQVAAFLLCVEYLKTVYCKYVLLFPSFMNMTSLWSNHVCLIGVAEATGQDRLW